MHIHSTVCHAICLIQHIVKSFDPPTQHTINNNIIIFKTELFSNLKFFLIFQNRRKHNKETSYVKILGKCHYIYYYVNCKPGTKLLFTIYFLIVKKHLQLNQYKRPLDQCYLCSRCGIELECHAREWLTDLCIVNYIVHMSYS